MCLWNTEKGYRSFGVSKPKACFPVYPVTSYRLIDAEDWTADEDDPEDWDPDEEKDKIARATVGCTMKEACESCFEIPEHTEGFPPTAIFVTAEDEIAEHSGKLADALTSAGIPCRIETGPTGWHGFADGTGMCMEGWPKRAADWYEQVK